MVVLNMQIDEPTDRLKPCKCGREIIHYTLGYSIKPCYVGCRCGQVTDGYYNLDDLVKAWNNAQV